MFNSMGCHLSRHAHMLGGRWPRTFHFKQKLLLQLLADAHEVSCQQLTCQVCWPVGVGVNAVTSISLFSEVAKHI